MDRDQIWVNHVQEWLQMFEVGVKTTLLLNVQTNTQVLVLPGGLQSLSDGRGNDIGENIVAPATGSCLTLILTKIARRYGTRPIHHSLDRWSW